MRLDEIEDNNKETVEQLLKQYYTVNGPYQITDDGTVNVDGHVWYHGTGNFPIKFDVVHGIFDCKSAMLSTLEGSPRYVGGQFICFQNGLTSLNGGPKIVGDRYSCYENPLTSLEGLPLQCKNGWILLDYNEDLPLLRLLSIKNLNNIVLVPSTGAESQELSSILNKYLGQGRKGAIQCAAEMIKAGYKGNARL